MATRNDELLAYLQSLGLGNTQAPIEMAVPGFGQNFANYQAIPANSQYNPYAVPGDGSPYEQIMARMNSQNYAPSPYGGLLGPTNNGGYNTAGGSSLNQAVLDNYQGYSGIGGGGGGTDNGGASAWGNMTPGEQASFYAANPTMSAITQAGQKALGNTMFGMALQGLGPISWGEQAMIARGVDPATMGELNAAVQANAGNMSGGWTSGLMGTLGDQPGDYDGQGSGSIGGFGVGGDLSGGYGDAAGYGADGGGYNGGDSNDGGGDGGVSGGGGGGAAGDGGTGDGGGDGGGGGGDGGGDGGGGGAGWAKGGLVNKVWGKNPMGQDDGAGYLDLGEYVIRKSAVKKYGKGLLDMINEGKVPAKKIKSLLD